MTSRDGTIRTFELEKERISIGRSRRCDLHIALPSISPIHCEITQKGSRIDLHHKDPSTETLHNGKSVTTAKLMNSDHVKIGPVEFTVQINDNETVIRRH